MLIMRLIITVFTFMSIRVSINDITSNGTLYYFHVKNLKSFKNNNLCFIKKYILP